jgi:hypothetical protein
MFVSQCMDSPLQLQLMVAPVVAMACRKQLF